MNKVSIICFVLLLVLLTSATDVKDAPQLSNVVNLIAVKALGDYYRKNTRSNVLINPVSIFSVVTLLLPGTNGYVKGNVKKALGLSASDGEEIKNVSTFYKNLSVSTNATQNIITHSVWLQKGLHMKKPYADFIKTMDTAIDSIDFLDQSTAEATINSWVDNKTQGKILNFFKKDLPQSTQVVVLSANYFKGPWMQKFNASKTATRTFYNAQKSQVSFMRTEGQFRYYANQYYESIRLPYQDKRFSFVVYLPSVNTSLQDLINQISPQLLLEPLAHEKESHYAVELPKFALEYSCDLLQLLEDMGFVQTDNVSLFEGMTESAGLQFHKVLHATTVEVNEEGSEAAGVTGAVLKKSLDVFFINRPFLFTIVDEQQDVILYIGAVVNPGGK